MSGETCNIFGRCINRKTGQLTGKTSQLHSDLLDLTKQSKEIKEYREVANKMFLLSQSSVFSKEYYRDLYSASKSQDYDSFINDNPEVEPSIWNLYTVLYNIQNQFGTYNFFDSEVYQLIKNDTLPSLQDVLQYFNNKFSERTFNNYEDALNFIRTQQEDFSTNALFMLSVTVNNDGSFGIEAVENTKENQQKLLDDIAAFENVEMLLAALQNRGIEVSIIDSMRDALIQEIPKDSSGILDNVQAIIQSSSESFNAQLAYKTALFIVKTLEGKNEGKGNPLVERLKRIASSEYQTYKENRGLTSEDLGNNKGLFGKIRKAFKKKTFLEELKFRNRDLWRDLGLENGGDISALAAFMLAGYLENIQAARDYLDQNPILKLCQRITDWLKNLFKGLSFTYASNKIAARIAAVKIVKQFTGDTYKLNISAATVGKKGIREDTKVLFDALSNGLKDLDYALQELKNINYEAYKAFNKQFRDRLTNLHQIVRDIENHTSENIFEDTKAQVEMLNELTSLCAFIGESLGSCKDSLNYVIRGVDKDGNPVGYKEGAQFIKYTENIIRLSRNLLATQHKIMAYVDSSVTFTDANGFRYSLGDYKNKLSTVFDSLNELTSSLIIIEPGSNGERKRSMEEALQMAREAVACQLLVEINGSDFIAIEQYVCFHNKKVLRKAATAYSMEDLLKRTLVGDESVDCCPSVQWISRFIDSMADNPDIINQMVHDKVSRQKHVANMKAVSMMERLRALYNAIPTKHGTRNTRRFMEVDRDNKLTGNVISKRHMGNWEKAFNDFKKDWRDNYYALHKKDYSSMDEMLADKFYLVEYGKAVERWHMCNSKEVIVTNAKTGEEITYDDGTPKKMYVPLIEEEVEERMISLQNSELFEDEDYEINTYDNEQFRELSNEDRMWLREYLSIKQELDALLPQGAVPMGGLRAPQFKGSLTKRIGNLRTQGSLNTMLIGVKWLKLEFQEAAGQSPFETEFGGENNTYDSDLYDNEGNIIFTRAHSNLIQSIPQIPMFGIRKLQDTDYLSTDLCSSLMAYAAMAYNYECLNEVVGAIEVTKDALKKGRKTAYDITLEDMRRSDSQEAGVYGRLEDYIHQQIYSIYTDSNKSTLNRACRKIFQKISRFGSSWYLGFNLHGAIVNDMTAVYQIWRRAFKYGKAINCAKAHAIYFFYSWGIQPWMRMRNLFKPGSDYSETHDMLKLFQRRYNISNDNQEFFKNWNIGTTGYTMMFKQSIGNIMHGFYSYFESYMSSISYIMTALDTDLVYKDRGEVKKTNLWDALRNSIVTKEIDVNGTKVKTKEYDFSYDKYYILDRNASDIYDFMHSDNPKAKTMSQSAAWQKELQDYRWSEEVLGAKRGQKYIKYDETQDSRVRNTAQMGNNQMHGIYNTQDAGAFLKYAVSGAAASLHKYSIGLLDSRFARARYDFRTRRIFQGEYVTFFEWALLEIIFNPMETFQQEDAAHALGAFCAGLLSIASMPLQLVFNRTDRLKKLGLSTSQIYNMKAVLTDQILAMLLQVALSLWQAPVLETPPDDEDEETWKANLEEEYSTSNRWLRALVDSLPSSFRFIGKGGKFLTKPLKGTPLGFMAEFFEHWPTTKSAHGGADYYLADDNEYSDDKMDMFSKAMMNLYLKWESILPFEKSINDEKVVTKEHLFRAFRKASKKNGGVVPFSLQAIAHYVTYRNLIELVAYNPFYIVNTYTELRSLMAQSLPGQQALVDVVSLTVQTVSDNFFPLTQEEVDKLGKKGDNYDNGKRIYTKGLHINYYKWFKKLEKSALDPLRSWAQVLLSGYIAEDNFQFYLNKEGDQYLLERFGLAEQR